MILETSGNFQILYKVLRHLQRRMATFGWFSVAFISLWHFEQYYRFLCQFPETLNSFKTFVEASVSFNMILETSGNFQIL